MNELELLAEEGKTDCFKHILWVANIVATDHQALLIFLIASRASTTHKSRLTRWAKRLIPFQFKVFHLFVRDKVIKDFISREPPRNPLENNIL